MSPPKKNEPADRPGVLSNLPRTRPQRASPRRAAARKAAAATVPAGATGEPTPKASSRSPASSNGRPPASTKDSRTRTAQKATAPRTTAAPKRARSAPKRTAGAATSEPAPRQGFECEGERVNGPIQPPGGAELVAGAAELIGELAKAGISTGERLFKDVLSRLPLS
ncbi:MAG: hypothetical protein ABR992_16390 [Solirubrobacteraceae bacterium]|jgi:hypothetical protein